MKPNLVTVLAAAGLLAGSFLIGRGTVHVPLLEPQMLEAQDRGPGQLPARGTGGTQVPGAPVAAPAKTPPLVYGGDSSSSGSSNGFIAVTGSYGVGTSVLYVLDTNTRQLAVYEARGGSRGSRSLFLVGARKIDLDLQLLQYNDDSEYAYDALKRRFEDAGHRADAKADAVPTVPGKAAERQTGSSEK